MPNKPTLYRIEYRKPNEPDTHVAVLPDGGVLVPVEPDQDSAVIALLSPATVKAVGVSMSYNQAKALVRVVLVGAGIGDTDHSVRAWAERQGIPLESLENPAADVPGNPYLIGDTE